jgi:hypothetical protein
VFRDLRQRSVSALAAIVVALITGAAGGAGGVLATRAFFPSEKVTTITVAGGPASSAYTQAASARARLAAVSSF